VSAPVNDLRLDDHLTQERREIVVDFGDDRSLAFAHLEIRRQTGRVAFGAEVTRGGVGAAAAALPGDGRPVAVGVGDRRHDHHAEIGKVERLGDLVGGGEDVVDLAFADGIGPRDQIRDGRRDPVHLLMEQDKAGHFGAAQHQEEQDRYRQGELDRDVARRAPRNCSCNPASATVRASIAGRARSDSPRHGSNSR
jgi:hypothetical protein